MCQGPQRTMYEGKNIHYSSTDSKLLCSFSGKLCNQRRLNGYGFCVRHILEDPTAPFKQCAYVAKSSNQMCTQAIPKHEERRYCNNHMQVLGMLPKKERKKKEKPSPLPESKLHLTGAGSMKAKFSLSKDNNTPVIKPAPPSAGDPDDPYAFPDAGPSENKSSGAPGSLPTSSDSILGKSLQSGQGFVRSASDISSTGGLGISGGSMIAKYYPELAEKLEKMRAKPEPKTTAKSRARSSRTMNKLQTKIAQNKINEKLRKSQELSQTDSNSSPLQISSPEQSAGIEHSPSPGPVFSPASSHTFSPQAPAPTNFSSNISLAGYEQGQTTHDIPPLPQVDTSFLATLAAQDNLGFQNSVNETGMSDRLLAPHTPPRLPPPYPGSSTLSTPSSLTSSDLPTSAFSPQANLNSVLESLNPSHSPQQTTVTQTGPSGPSSLSSLPFTPPQPRHSSLQNSTPPAFLSPASSSSSFPSANGTSNYPYGSSDLLQSGIKTLNNHLSTTLAPPNVDIFSLLNINPKQLSIDPATGLQQSHMLPSPNTLAAHLSLPPPPPYVPPSVPPKVTVSSTTVQSKQQSKLTTTSSATVSSMTPKVVVPQTKLHKLSGILTEKAAKRKLKGDLAVKFYSFYARRKISNHCMVGPYLCSSDDDSDDEDADMLPWQRDVFSASSDEEVDDDELEIDIPMEMRPTKLSLLKTRLRRQWCQARNAHKTNSVIRKNSNQATLALIRTVRDSAACAVRALWQIAHVRKSKRKLQKRLRKKKICCNKNEKEGQCKNQCLPYANHCIKHITYNINQQLFDFCTAKFANNVQCCLPSFDLRHELPLCLEHAAKADNYQKQLELENKKKPRKKSKPPALTRPPRKGKKKKKGRYAKAQKPVPQADSGGLDSTLSDVDVTSIEPSKPEEGAETTTEASSSATKEEESSSSTTKPAQPTSVATGFTALPKDNTKNLEQSLELEETLSPDFDKPFELPLEQASRLLDESDFQEVVNKMPFDALDLFGKNGEPEADPETEHMNVDLSANKARDALEKLLTGTMSEEESMQLAMVLAQNLSSDADLAQNAGLISEAMPVSTTTQGEMRMLSGSVNIGMDMAMPSHVVGVSGMDSSGVVSVGSDHSLMTTQSSALGDSSGLGVAPVGMVHISHPQQQQQGMLPQQQQHIGMVHTPNLSSVSVAPSSYGHQEGLKMTTASLQLQQHHQQQQIHSSLPSASSTSVSTMERVPSVFTADLNAVYGQIESLTQSQLAAKQSSGLNLNHIAGLEAFTTTSAKTVIRHLPSESQPILSVAGTTAQSHFAPSGQALFQPSQMSSQVSLEPGRSVVNLDTSSTPGFNTSTLPVINAQSRQGTGPQHQNFTTHSLPNLLISSSVSMPSSSSSAEQLSSSSSSLSLPSRAKKAKMAISSNPQSVIPHQPSHKQLQQPQPQHLHPQLQRQQLQQHIQQHPQQQQPQRSTTVRHMLQASASSSGRRLTLPDSNTMVRPGDRVASSSKNTVGGTSIQSGMTTSPPSKRRLTLPGVETVQHQDPSKSNFVSAQALSTDSGILKLPSSATGLSDINQGKLSLPVENTGSQHTVSLTQSYSPSSRSSPKSNMAMRYSLTGENSLTASSMSPLTTTTSIRHSFLGDSSNVATESISVTVRHPSPAESVPTTVRHTLPDTLSMPMTLPSSPAFQLPPASTSSTSPSSTSSSSSSLLTSASQQLQAQDLHPPPKLQQTNISPQSSTSLHPELQAVLSSQRPQWVPAGSLPSNISIQNGLPFVSTPSRGQLTNKLSPAGQGNVRNKPNSSVSETARITALGVPVVCSPVSLPGFVQGMSTTTFKSSGSS